MQTLEEICPKCGGHKIYRIYNSINRDAPCNYCNASGIVLTESGKELLEFLKKYYPHPTYNSCNSRID